jgi:hypothetical protein
MRNRIRNTALHDDFNCHSTGFFVDDGSAEIRILLVLELDMSATFLMCRNFAFLAVLHTWTLDILVNVTIAKRSSYIF